MKKETSENKSEFTIKFSDLDERMDLIRTLKHKQRQVLQEFKQNNNMMYFFPIKVQEQKDRIERKKLELELYRKIINDSLGFMRQKILENKHKQSLVAQINDHIGDEIKLMLDQEQQFYLSDDKDMLKTPPHVYVKRIERPGVSVEPVQVPITKRRSTSP